MNIMIKNDIFIRSHLTEKSNTDVWLLHGFGESSLSFQEAFIFEPFKSFNIYAPDFPGSGVSPSLQGVLDILHLEKIVTKLISDISGNRPLIIIAHSLAGIIATRICSRLSSQLKAYVNIEGNLTSSDAFFSGLAKDYQSAKSFYEFFVNAVFAKINDSDSFRRYYASVRFADATSLWTLGKSGAEHSPSSIAGREFLALNCKKIYVWGSSAPEETQNFIHNENLPNLFLPNSGHWPMIDDPDFYEKIFRFIEK